VNTDAPWPDATMARQRVLTIQTKLHQWATDDPGRRFDDLGNLVYDAAVLVEAWHRVRRNRGARTAGLDGETAYYVTTVRGEQAFLSELRDELKTRRFQPLPVREVTIPKPGSTKRRRLGIAVIASYCLSCRCSPESGVQVTRVRNPLLASCFNLGSKRDA